jgi:Zn ribbon nucleic-acid-binding protein
MKVGRNDKCPCGSGKKYKKCCLEKDEQRASLKQRVMKISRRDFISGPYKKCPNPQCLNDDTFGVFTSIVGSKKYTRECIKCGHKEGFDLPNIKKKIVYLDQFVISNLIKLLDKSHPSHEKIEADHFWKTLFIKLEAASKSQAIVCPDSFYHRDESLTGNIDFRLMKRLYEHFSSGKTLYPSIIIQRNQIAQHFEGWLANEKVKFEFKPEDIAFARDLHTWSVGLRISVGGNPYPEQIGNLQSINTTIKEQLKAEWARWQSETNFGFVERVKEATSGLGKGLINEARKFTDLSPMSNDVLEALMRIARKRGISNGQIPETIVRYFNDTDELLEIPQIRISSVMFAGLARRAALGKKNPPKSTADVQFISSYLPYCDALFVDKESALILKEFPKNTPSYLRLKEFPAKIFSLNNRDEFLAYLDQLVVQIPSEQIDILKDMGGDDYAKPYWSIIEHEKRKRE